MLDVYSCMHTYVNIYLTQIHRGIGPYIYAMLTPLHTGLPTNLPTYTCDFERFLKGS